MNNIIKKITAITMAFTLLGSVTAIAKNVSPKSANTLTASAACKHHGYAYRTTSNWQNVFSKSYRMGANLWSLYQERTVNIRCGSCSKVTYSFKESRVILADNKFREIRL